MTFATHASKRGSRRSLALLSALAVLMSLMTIYATPAQAHHPTTTASQICEDGKVFISFTSTSWQIGEPGHPDVRVEVSVNGGTWTEVDSGAYTEANDYSFSGTFAAEAYWGESIRVRSQVVGTWPNGAATGNSNPEATTAAFTVDQDCFNPSCPNDLIQLKLEGGSLKSGTHGPNDEFTIAISGKTFDWTSTVPVFQVIAKGGPGANVYDYPGGDFADTGLHAPTNPNNSKYYGLSHITLCYQEGGDQDDPVEVTVIGGECIVGQQGVATGSANVAISPDSQATVEIFDDAEMESDDKVGERSSTGTVDGLPPGTYYWKATAADGYELEGDGDGTFTISDCLGSVVVVANACTVNQQGQPTGSADITIDPDSGATVHIYNDAAMTSLAASVAPSGSVVLAPGTYYWEAESAPGFDLTGDEIGQFTIDPCDVTVNATGSCEVVDNVGVGTIEITVSVPGSVSLEIPGVGTFDENDTANVATGATYSWSATPNAGFAISGDSSGDVVIDDCTPPEVGASIVVTVDSSCVVVDDQGQGVIDVVVSVDNGATVVIRDSAGEVVETLTSDGSLTVTAGATYTWEATPNTGFEFPPDFTASGSIDIEDCTPTPPPPPPTPDEVMASILVTVDSFCQDGDGFVDIDLSVAGGATVVVSDSDGDVMGTLTADGTITVPEGATYDWVATPSEGFEFPPGFVASGSITIESCSDPETLPFTGMDLDVAAAFAAAFLGAGITVLASQWRREEQ